MKQITVIGDIHGCYNTFLELLKKIPKEDTIVSVGDLVDRGPFSKQVVQYMIDHPEILVVKANHEDMMINDMLGDPSAAYYGEWKATQAAETMNSYRKEDGTVDLELMREHAKWMANLPLFLEFPDVKLTENTYLNQDHERHLVVSHSSIGNTWRFRDPNSEGHHWFENGALWNRDVPRDVKDIYNIFGHTPNTKPKVKSFYANIDTGCVFNRSGYDKLTAIRFPSLKLITQENVDTDPK